MATENNVGAAPGTLGAVVLRVVEAGFFRSDVTHPAAQMYDGDWWAPRFGCDSLEACMDELETIISQNAEGQGCRASRHTLDPLVRPSESGGAG